MKDTNIDVKRLATKHWRDTKAIHLQFLRDLKRAWKETSR
jgi:hypothetical protein